MRRRNAEKSQYLLPTGVHMSVDAAAVAAGSELLQNARGNFLN